MRTDVTARRLLLLISMVAAIWVAPALLSAERLTDKDVRALLDRIDDERDRFEDQLDGKLKRSILRGPRGEVDVERYLDDLQENVDRLKERFKSDYAASAEVTAVLRQASDIHRFMATQPPDLDGASEWNRLSASFGTLATAYGTRLPVPDGDVARRLNDREVKKTAEELGKSADRFKNDLESSLRKDPAVDPAALSAAVSDADALKQDAKRLASVVGDGRPASGEAQAVLERASRVSAASAGRTLSPAAQASWREVETGLDAVARAFGLTPANR